MIADAEAAAAAQDSGDESEFEGMWRDGNFLIVHRRAVFPDICLKSNEPAEGSRFQRRLVWFYPLIILVFLLNPPIGVVLYVMFRKVVDIDVGLSAAWHARRRRRIQNAARVIVAGFILLLLAMILAVDSPLHEWLVLGSLLVMLVGMMYWRIGGRLFSAAKITDDHIWVDGVHRGFLARLPDRPRSET